MAGRPRLDVAVEPCVAALRAIDEVRIQPLQTLHLPEREKPIDVRVKQEHERVTERDVLPAHHDEPVHRVVDVLEQCAHRGVVACGHDCLVLAEAGR